ncbi:MULTISPECIES: hypothetical protein [Pseudomonas]|nr:MULTISPECIES: hypothetical protein [Pseudomonas]MDM3874427.1 hypothetical protein [Pseudomonas asiatica]WJR24518.1 hypothetical protein LU687_009065 [Pseudomonas asiatica]WJR24941.1 hypothetical protein LU687_011340 [Pseudomonas asiatica]
MNWTWLDTAKVVLVVLAVTSTWCLIAAREIESRRKQQDRIR